MTLRKGLSIKEPSVMVLPMDMDPVRGDRGGVMSANGLTTGEKDMAFYVKMWRVEKFTMVPGRTINGMVMVNSNSMEVDVTRENSKTIKSKVGVDMFSSIPVFMMGPSKMIYEKDMEQ